MEWRDVASNGSLLVNRLLYAWTMGIEAARSERSWPKVSIKFLKAVHGNAESLEGACDESTSFQSSL